MGNVKNIESYKIRNLYNELIEENYKALDVFWDEVKKSGSPIYEGFQSGHDFLSWGEKLATGLIALIGKKNL